MSAGISWEVERRYCERMGLPVPPRPLISLAQTTFDKAQTFVAIDDVFVEEVRGGAHHVIIGDSDQTIRVPDGVIPFHSDCPIAYGKASGRLIVTAEWANRKLKGVPECRTWNRPA